MDGCAAVVLVVEPDGWLAGCQPASGLGERVCGRDGDKVYGRANGRVGRWSAGWVEGPPWGDVWVGGQVGRKAGGRMGRVATWVMLSVFMSPRPC